MTIQEVLSEAGVDYVEAGGHQHARQGWVQLKFCPFCSSSNYHLGFNIAHKYAVCWRCGWHPAFLLFQQLNIAPKLAKELDVDLGRAPKQERTGLKEPKHRGPLLTAHQEYLKRRGLDPDQTVKLWQAEGIGVATRLSWRIYIPIMHEGKRVSWTTRAIGDTVEQRYISAAATEEAVNHRSLLYGLEYVRDTALVVEGPFDVWNVGPGAVGLFGLNYSAAQVQKIAKIPNRFVCLDKSMGAQAVARKLAGELSCLPGRTQILRIDAEDPGSATKHEVKTIRRIIGLGNYNGRQ